MSLPCSGQPTACGQSLAFCHHDTPPQKAQEGTARQLFWPLTLRPALGLGPLCSDPALLHRRFAEPGCRGPQPQGQPLGQWAVWHHEMPCGAPWVTGTTGRPLGSQVGPDLWCGPYTPGKSSMEEKASWKEDGSPQVSLGNPQAPASNQTWEWAPCVQGLTAPCTARPGPAPADPAVTSPMVKGGG